MIFPGIDLGTTFSMIAHVNAHGQPALFPDVHNASQFRTPSVVYVGREGCLIGDAAEELLEDAPELNVARFVKARLSQSTWRYADWKDRQWSAEALSALIVRKLLKDADTFANEPIGQAVVTVPAQFTDEQRRATLRAASLAGLGSVRLIEEPVAAATFYGLDEGAADKTLLVYDFGGGTFDVTILQTSKDGLFVLASDGIANLGGRILDERIMAVIAEGFQRKHGRSPLADPASSQRLRRIAEQAKIKLSKPGPNQVTQSLLLLGQPFDFAFTRQQFDALMTEAVSETLASCQRCLQAASLTWKDVDKVLLTGGSSMIPHVQHNLLQVSGKNPRDVVCKQPHQAVAFGAAILAHRFGRDRSGAGTIQQVSGADLCLRVWDRQTNRPGLEMLIERNTPLPTSYSRTFYTNRDDQVRLVLEFVQRRGQPAEEFSLGHFAFGPIRDPKRNYPVEVTVSLESDGLVRVTARDQVTGAEMAHTLEEGGGGNVPQDLVEQRRLVESASVNT